MTKQEQQDQRIEALLDKIADPDTPLDEVRRLEARVETLQRLQRANR